MLRLLPPTLDRLEVLELQLGVHHLLVPHRVDRPIDVDDIGILEAAKHVDDRVGLTDIGEELVPQPLALAGTAHETGNVDDLHRRRDDALRVDDLGEGIEPFVRHGDRAEVGLNGAEGEVGRLRLGIGERIE